MRASYFRRFVLLSAVAVFFQGCAVGPNTERLAAFGEAANKANNTLVVPFNLSASLGVDIAKYAATCDYLHNSRNVNLGAPANLDVNEIIPQLRAVHLALGGYVKALSEVTDPAGINALRAAGKSFSDQAVKVLGSASGAPIAPTVGPGLNLGVNLFITLTEIERLRQISVVMKDVNPYLVLLDLKLQDDTKVVVDEVDRLIGIWDDSVKCVLRASAGDRADSAELFLALDVRKRELLAMRQAVTSLAGLFEKVAETHGLAAEQPASIDQQLDALNLLLDDIEALAVLI